MKIALFAVLLTVFVTESVAETPHPSIARFYRALAAEHGAAASDVDGVLVDNDAFAQQLRNDPRYREHGTPVAKFILDHRELFLGAEPSSLKGILCSTPFVFTALEDGHEKKGLNVLVYRADRASKEPKEVVFRLDPASGRIEAGAIKIGGLDGVSLMEVFAKEIGRE